MSDKPDRPRDVPPAVVRNADGTIVPGTQPPHEPQVVRGSAFAAMPDTPFTPDPAIAGGQMPVQPGEGVKQAVDPNQPVYANPQASAAWANSRPLGEKERLELEMNEGVVAEPQAEHDVMPEQPPMHDAPPSEGEHAQETEEARRLREEQERLERERRDAERQEEERRQQEQHQG